MTEKTFEWMRDGRMVLVTAQVTSRNGIPSRTVGENATADDVVAALLAADPPTRLTVLEKMPEWAEVHSHAELDAVEERAEKAISELRLRLKSEENRRHSLNATLRLETDARISSSSRAEKAEAEVTRLTEELAEAKRKLAREEAESEKFVEQGDRYHEVATRVLGEQPHHPADAESARHEPHCLHITDFGGPCPQCPKSAWSSGDHERLAADEWTFNAADVVAQAVLLPTLAEALSHAATLENERAIRQAFRNARDGVRGADAALWDTAFRHLFEMVLAGYKAPVTEKTSSTEYISGELVRKLYERLRVMEKSLATARSERDAAKAELDDWRTWAMALCNPPITCDEDMREQLRQELHALNLVALEGRRYAERNEPRRTLVQAKRVHASGAGSCRRSKKLRFSFRVRRLVPIE